MKNLIFFLCALVAFSCMAQDPEPAQRIAGPLLISKYPLLSTADTLLVSNGSRVVGRRPASDFLQSLTLNGQILGITGGNTVDLSNVGQGGGGGTMDYNLLDNRPFTTTTLSTSIFDIDMSGFDLTGAGSVTGSSADFTTGYIGTLNGENVIATVSGSIENLVSTTATVSGTGTIENLEIGSGSVEIGTSQTDKGRFYRDDVDNKLYYQKVSGISVPIDLTDTGGELIAVTQAQYDLLSPTEIAENDYAIVGISESTPVSSKLDSITAGTNISIDWTLPKVPQISSTYVAPVSSVNGNTGTVVLSAGDIGVSDVDGNYTATDVEGVLAEIYPQLGGGGTGITDGNKGEITVASGGTLWTVNNGAISEPKLNLSVNASLDLADTSLQPTDNISSLTNDLGFISSVTWNDVTLKPTSFNPSAHSHIIGDISNLSSYTGFDSRYFTETEINSRFSGATAVTGYNKSNWDAAFGWGNHALAGYTSNTGTVTSVAAGNGLSGTTITGAGTISLGTPGTLTGSTTNATTTTSHTHAISLTAANVGAEPSFVKNTAFNKNFGTASGTVAQGNDSRINNGQTAFGWGNHASGGYAPATRNIAAGNGLTGGGDLSANRTITLGTPGTLTGSTTNSTTTTSHTHAVNLTAGDVGAYTMAQSDGKYLLNTTDALIGSLDVTQVLTMGNNSRIRGNGVGDANQAVFNFYANDGTTLQGQIGFSGTANSHMRFFNAVSSQQIILDDGGGINGLKFNIGGSDQTVWHSGNDGSTSTLDAGLFHGMLPSNFVQTSITLTGGDGINAIGNLTTNRTVSVDATVARTNVAEVFSSTVTATGFYESSDMRLKTNIEKISPSFYSFEFKDEPGVKRYGTIAQALQMDSPELVKEGENGMLAVNYIDLLVKKVAELENRIIELEKRLEK